MAIKPVDVGGGGGEVSGTVVLVVVGLKNKEHFCWI
jgi:hypothetical protein